MAPKKESSKKDTTSSEKISPPTTESENNVSNKRKINDSEDAPEPKRPNISTSSENIPQTATESEKNVSSKEKITDSEDASEPKKPNTTTSSENTPQTESENNVSSKEKITDSEDASELKKPNTTTSSENIPQTTMESENNVSSKEKITDSENASEPKKLNITTSEKTPQTKTKLKTLKNYFTKRAGTDDQDDTPKPKNQKLNKVDSDLDNLCVSCFTKTPDGRGSNFKIASWNVAGIRACLKKNGLEYIKKEQPDIVCLQEVKCSEKKLPPEVKIEGYRDYWCLGTKEGYAGVGLYSKIKPLKVKYGLDKPEYDSEGRVITAEYDDFFLVTVYVPNAGSGLKNLSRRKQWDIDFRNYLKSLDAKKPVILCGDMNVSHQPIDLANPKTNTKTPGYTEDERAGMTSLLSEGFVDTFRHLYPEKTGAYTFWNYMGNARSRNVGWRLDYFILSKRYLDNMCDNIIQNEVYGSDHCPIVLYLSV